jgi:CheY-like chemotaxis protein
MKRHGHLTTLMLVTVVPVLLGLGVFLILLGWDEQSSVERRMGETARTITAAVDRELEVSVGMLQALAASASLEAGDVRAFAREARRVRVTGRAGWSGVRLMDPSGRLLAAEPAGAPPAPSPAREAIRAAAASGRPVVSDLFADGPGAALAVAIALPALRGAEVRYVLCAFLPAARWSALLAAPPLPASWAARIVDSHGATLAQAMGTNGASGSQVGYVASGRSRISGWAVALEVPAAMADGPVWRSLWLTIVGLLTMLAGLVVAAMFARRLAKPRAVPDPVDELERGGFVMPLPLRPDGALPPESAPAVVPIAGGRRRVLLVEDNRDVRDGLRLFLEEWGYRVEEAADGPSGLARALEGAFDVALIDVGLPGLDGYAVAERIRAAPVGRRLRLVALTGYGQPEDRRRAREAGFDAHVVKPVDPDDILPLLA